MTYGPAGDPLTSKIAVIAEAPSTYELIHGVPLAGPSGHVFNSLLHHAGLIRSALYITNLFDVQVHKKWQKPEIYLEDDFQTLLWSPSRGFTAAADRFISRLDDELSYCKANVLVPMGGPATEALTSKSAITKWRGSILPATITMNHGRKVIPTIHPAATLRGQYIWRYHIVSDFERVKEQSAFPEIRRPPYRFVLNATLETILTTLRWLRKTKPMISVDTEASNSQMSLIGIAWSDLDCLVIPFNNSWDIHQEVAIWRELALILEDPDIAKIFQNSSFDRSFLYTKHDIFVQGAIEDTMVMHHIMYPDFLKRLPFLVSLYTEQPFYKDMVKHDKVSNKEG